jgi:methionyl aminopeptidase
MLFPKRKVTKQILNEQERQGMRKAGAFNGKVLDFIRPHVRAGVSTLEIDQLIHEYTMKHGHIPATLGYLHFPKSCCTSINNVICHGIPGEYVLREGDIVNIDCTTIVDGWHGDSSETFMIGKVSDSARQVMQCSHDALWAAIDALTPNCSVATIGDAIVAEANKYKFGVVREFVGHGIGKKFHENYLSIPHYPTRVGRSIHLEPGMCFTIEPMINVGQRYTVLDKTDNWTVRTRDGSLSAQFEHTILMTEYGPEVLTPTQHGPQRGHQF